MAGVRPHPQHKRTKNVLRKIGIKKGKKGRDIGVGGLYVDEENKINIYLTDKVY